MAGRGGARAGAGRKPKADRFARQILSVDRQIVKGLGGRITTIEALADGGLQVTVDKLMPAGLIQIDGNEIVERGGDKDPIALKVKVLAFPDHPPDELILVERRIRVALPDLKANVYLANRIMGSPARQPDEEEAEIDLGPLYDLSLLTDEELREFKALASKCAVAKRIGS